MVDCPVCGQNIENEKICPNCGSAIRIKDSVDNDSSDEHNVKYCTNCGEIMDKNSSFCTKCGKGENDNNPTGNNISKKSSVTKNRNNLFYIIGIIAAIIVVAVVVSMSVPHGNTTINGVDFNIPEGYIENVQEKSSFEKGFLSTFPYEDKLYYEVQAYSNDYNTIYIAVVDAPSNPDLNRIGGQSVSINGHDGKMITEYGFQFFFYSEYDKVIVLAGDWDLIEDVVI